MAQELHPAVALFDARRTLHVAQQNAAACEKDFGAACLCSEMNVIDLGSIHAHQNVENIARARAAMRSAYDRVIAAEFEVSRLTKIVAKQVDDDIAAEKTAARLRHDAITTEKTATRMHHDAITTEKTATRMCHDAPVATDLEKEHRSVVHNLLEEQKRVYEERTAALIASLVAEDEAEKNVEKQIAADRAYAESLEKQANCAGQKR
jgi:hypothetical protein